MNQKPNSEEGIYKKGLIEKEMKIGTKGENMTKTRNPRDTQEESLKKKRTT